MRLLRFSGLKSVQEYVIEGSVANLAFSSQKASIQETTVLTAKVEIARAAYGHYKTALINTFLGLRGLMEHLAGQMVLLDEFVKYLEQSRLEAVRGESRISVEEKQLYQLIVYGSLFPDALDISLATKIINIGVDVICYGYMIECVGKTFLEEYQKSLSQFVPLYSDAMSKLVAELPLKA
jgi:hypothetical protein